MNNAVARIADMVSEMDTFGTALVAVTATQILDNRPRVCSALHKLSKLDYGCCIRQHCKVDQDLVNALKSVCGPEEAMQWFRLWAAHAMIGHRTGVELIEQAVRARVAV